jgi:hypothetical protein
MKCRQTGIVAELYSRMGMAVVNMPGGEILPAAERGTPLGHCRSFAKTASPFILRQPRNLDSVRD